MLFKPDIKIKSKFRISIISLTYLSWICLGSPYCKNISENQFGIWVTPSAGIRSPSLGAGISLNLRLFNDKIFTLQYLNSTEFMTSNNFDQNSNEISILFGKSLQRRNGLLLASIGLTYVRGEIHGKYLGSNSGLFSSSGSEYEKKSFETIGIPIQAQGFFNWKVIGIGISIDANINYKYALFGFSFIFPFGIK